MIMSNNEKEEYIRKRLSSDKVIASGDDLKRKINKDIDISKIRLKQHTFGERRFIGFLIILLIISIISNIYLISDLEKFDTSVEATNPAKTIVIEDNIPEEEEYVAEVVENTIKETENIVEESVSASNTVVENISKPELVVQESVKNHKELDEALLLEELTRYALTIGRMEEENDSLEKNTILLLIANNYFNKQVATNTGLDISANNKYAMTADNVHLFLKEMTGMQVNTFLDSYVNYIKYNEGSKFYASGSKSASLNGEIYEISNLTILSSLNGEYRLKGDINKKSTIEVQDKNKVVEKDIEANYTFETVVVINENYTYVPYLIKSFNAKIKNGEEDTIIRLIDQEETENKR